MTHTPGPPLNVGVIGAGFISQVAHLPALARLRTCRVTAVADNRDDVRRSVASGMGIPAGHADYHRLLANPDVAAVVVSMPRRAMGPIVEAALRSGKPTLSEKPMAYTLAQGEVLVGHARTAGVPYAIGFMRRHDPAVRVFRDRLHALDHSGDYGEILRVRVSDHCGRYAIPVPDNVRSPQPRPFRYEEWPVAPEFVPAADRSEYDYTVNVAVHDINLVRFLFGNDLDAVWFRIRPGRSQTAALVSAYPIIAVDLYDEKLTLARSMGATHAINGRAPDVGEQILGIVDGQGVDVFIDNTGVPAVIELGYDLTTSDGRVILVGVPAKGQGKWNRRAMRIAHFWHSSGLMPPTILYDVRHLLAMGKRQKSGWA